MEFRAKIALLALSFVGLGSLAYLLFYNRDDYDDEIPARRARCTEIFIEVPKDIAGVIIGCQGIKVKSIEEKYNVGIIFSDKKNDEDVRICRVRGCALSVRAAEEHIHSIIAHQLLIETEEIFIPSSACGLVIGTYGSNIRIISSQSKAKIYIDKERTYDDQKRVTIKGTPEQIASAKILIQQKVEEEENNRNYFLFNTCDCFSDLFE